MGAPCASVRPYLPRLRPHGAGRRPGAGGRRPRDRTMTAEDGVLYSDCPMHPFHLLPGAPSRHKLLKPRRHPAGTGRPGPRLREVPGLLPRTPRPASRTSSRAGVSSPARSPSRQSWKRPVRSTWQLPPAAESARWSSLSRPPRDSAALAFRPAEACSARRIAVLLAPSRPTCAGSCPTTLRPARVRRRRPSVIHRSNQSDCRRRPHRL
jgi:hypothetical protein